MAQPRQNLSPLIIAHRGASAVAPENTFAAFDHAIAAGSDGIEFDVRFAADGVPVVIHDADLKRTSGFGGSVDAYTSSELNQIDIGSWFTKNKGDVRFSDERIQTLSATLKHLRAFPGKIYIELKSEDIDVGPLAMAVCSAIKAARVSGEIVVKSFRLSAVPYVRQLCPKVRVAALFESKIMEMLRSERYLVNIAAEFGVNELSLEHSLATKKVIKTAGEYGLPVAIWTVDQPRWVKRAMRLGISAIITNDPARMIKKRAELLKESGSI